MDFATLDLMLAEQYQAELTTPAPSARSSFANAAINGFRNAFGSLLTLVLSLAESGPSLLSLGIPSWRLCRRYPPCPSALAGLCACGNVEIYGRQPPADARSPAEREMPVTAITRPGLARSQRL